jgi:hypothetical protein
LDPKRINRALFGAYYEEDIYDRLCTALPAVMRAFSSRIPPAMQARNLIFIHVPRAAGSSIMQALYGPGCTHHHSIRYFHALDPAFAAQARSFALLRDPFDRFASAFAFVRAGGTATARLSDVFVRQTRNVRTVDDYLAFLEGRGPLDLDFVMRPQAWFVCAGAPHGDVPLVRDLFVYGEDDAALARYLARHRTGPLPWLNRGDRLPVLLNRRQRGRIERLYAGDFALLDSVRQARDALRVAAIAAE